MPRFEEQKQNYPRLRAALIQSDRGGDASGGSLYPSFPSRLNVYIFHDSRSHEYFWKNAPTHPFLPIITVGTN